MGKGPTKPRGFGSLGLAASQTLGGAVLGGGIQDQLRRALVGVGGTSVSVASPSVLGIGQEFTISGDYDVSITDLPQGVYVANVLYSTEFDAGLTSAYVKAELSQNAAVFATGVTTYADGIGVALQTGCAGYFTSGSYPPRAIGTHFGDTSALSQTISLTVIRVA